MKSKPNIAIDLDGTLAGYTKGWQGPGKMEEPPVEGAKEALDILKKHFTILIFSVRAETKIGKKAIEEYCKKYNLYYDDIVTEKPQGILVDDSAINFSGNWKQTLKDIANFENWVSDREAI